MRRERRTRSGEGYWKPMACCGARDPVMVGVCGSGCGCADRRRGITSRHLTFLPFHFPFLSHHLPAVLTKLFHPRHVLLYELPTTPTPTPLPASQRRQVVKSSPSTPHHTRDQATGPRVITTPAERSLHGLKTPSVLLSSSPCHEEKQSRTSNARLLYFSPYYFLPQNKRGTNPQIEPTPDPTTHPHREAGIRVQAGR
jgi:hypothetical protein